mmetsp:Transcript_33971/g.60053  ORF Transcript_33971/g.60053 Transcript_33971/m.60053 type:complete len:1336 (+) Transcript_33971:117-4124(+)
MAVTSFDGSFSFKQDSLARLGDRSRPGKMSAEQRKSFNESPFMQSVRKTEEMCFEFTLSRDQKRAQTDKTFKPSDEDWNAPKAFNYDKGMNYYKVLGIDEYAPLDEVKKAYKKLSLIYHPDKTTHLEDKEKEEYAGIFIELKNAYLTLGDQATRRQYDRDRDREKAGVQVNGYKPKKERAQFDAAEVLKKLQENQKKPGKTINLPVMIKMEKFFYGGHKAVRRTKRVKDFTGFSSRTVTFRIDVKPGAPEPFECLFKGKGDHNEDTRPDSLAFQVKSKEHKVVRRVGNDLELKQKVPLFKEQLNQPYMWIEAPSVNGRYILMWGRNPFYMGAQEGNFAEIDVKIKGEGLSSSNYLKFKCSTGGGASPAGGAGGASAAGEGSTPMRKTKADHELITMRNMQTEAKLYMWARPNGTLMEARHKASQILGIPKNSGMRILRKLQDGRGYVPYSEQQMLGSLRELNVSGIAFDKVELTPERALSFLQDIAKELNSSEFQAELKKINVLAGADQSGAEARLSIAWENLLWILPEYGYDATNEVLRERILYATQQASRKSQQWKTEANNILKLITAYSKPQPDKASSTSAPTKSTTVAKPKKQAVPPAARFPAFLERHGLAPPGGLDDDSEEEEQAPVSTATHGKGGLCDNKKIARRVQKAKQGARLCDLEFQALGEPVVLFTKPTCKLHFYSNTRQNPHPPPGQVRPRAMFAVTISSQSCMANKARKHFELLKEQLIPVLKASIFRMLQASRALMPKALPDFAAFRKAEYKGIQIDEEQDSRSVPWKKHGDDAFKRGDFYTGIAAYSRCLEEMPDSDEKESIEAAATAYSNRSACLAKVGQFQEALADARKALEKRPKWGRAWSRAGLAASYMGKQHQKEAFDCYMQAVENDASPANVENLSKAAKTIRPASADNAHPEKERGNEAMRTKEFGLAVAHYTVAIALTPPEEMESGAEGKLQPKIDGHELLRAVLHSNRAGAFCRLKDWTAAVNDGKRAVQCKDDFVKGRVRLGTALLGAGYPEQAYPEFARALVYEPFHQAALKGREACLGVIPLWRSVPAKKRHRNRFAMDLSRPLGSTRVYAISDVHFDHKANEDWAHTFDDFKFSEDVLIVAGNMCDTRVALGRALVTFKSKFRRVFYVPGNHEMIVAGEQSKYADSMAKLLSIYDLCDELEVDIFPAAVCQGVFVVPLLSWYNGEFDIADPEPTIDDTIDHMTRWPIDKDMQVWKYMLKLNTEHLRHLYHGTVITFSHFIPRTGLRFEKRRKGGAKVVGCEGIDGQARAVKTKFHLYGHANIHAWSRESNVIYGNHYHGGEDEHSADAPLLCVWDGKALKRQEVVVH